MPSRVKVLEIELDAQHEPFENLEGYEALWALVRLHGYPIGHIEMPLSSGASYKAVDLKRVILQRLTWQIIRHHLLDITATAIPPEGVGVEELLQTLHTTDCEHPSSTVPFVTVAVCTRDRTEDLKLCLDALVRLEYPNLDILVVDNAPSNSATERLVNNSYPKVRYVREPIPGLDWARNRAILEARGEIIAYTDDDVVVDPGWVSALVRAFRNPQVVAVTGLTVPYELETEAQILFERYGGFDYGYQRRYFPETQLELGAGQCGAGANMAFRRSVFDEVGYFDPALDAGTVTCTGGDTEMFFRVLHEGYALVYEPGALVWHRHRREYEQLRKQLAGNSIGTFSWLFRVAVAYPEVRFLTIRFTVWWFWYWNIRRLLVSFVRPPGVPRKLYLTELWYSLVGVGRYRKASREAERVGKKAPHLRVLPKPSSPRQWAHKVRTSTGVRTVDIGRSLHALEDVTDYSTLRIFVMLHGKPLGFVSIPNQGHPVGVQQLRDAIVCQLTLELLRRGQRQSLHAFTTSVLNALESHYLPESVGTTDKTAQLPDT